MTVPTGANVAFVLAFLGVALALALSGFRKSPKP